MTQNNLANAYSNRIRGNRADNIEQAIIHVQQALTIYTQQAFPEKWAMTQNNLANAYSNRIRGNRADNIEQAIIHFQQALTIYTQQAFPEKWATTQNNLALAYNDRIRGNRADNLEQAIIHVQQALMIYTPQAFPEKWAMAQNNLALGYSSRIRGNRSDNIEQAIHHYKKALLVRTPQAFPADWAITQNNLAEAYYSRIRGNRADNLEQAIHHYQQALTIYTRQAFPEKWAMTQYNLANTYRNRIRGNRANNIRQAIHRYRQALLEYTTAIWPEKCRDVAYHLGWLLYDERRFKKARQALTTAHEAVEALRGEIERERDLRELAKKNVGLYARLVFCSLQVGDEEAAFKHAAAGKGRAFVDLLSSASVDLSAMGVENAHFQADWQTYREMRQEIEGLLLILTGDKGAKQVADGQAGLGPLLREVINRQWRNKQKAAAQHWQQMTIDYPALTACKSAPTLSAAQARDLSRQLNATLVEYYQHAEGWCAFVVTPDEVRHVALPDVNDKLIERMWKWTNRIKRHTGRGDLTYRRLSPWYQAVIAPLNLPSNSGQNSASGEGSAVVLAPFAALHLLPLAVAREPKSQRYVCQDHRLAFAPSLGALKVAHESRSKGKREAKPWQRALLVAYPGNPYLHNVLPESTRLWPF